MAYTIKHLYDKVLEGTDKMGSDFFDVSYVMNKLETATYDFIGETVKYLENTQEIRDDIRLLYKPFKIPVIDDPNDSDFRAIAIPNDYQHLMVVKVIDADVPVRKTRVIRHGQEEVYETNPNTKATAEYPTVVIYGDVIRILTPGNPVFVRGFYIQKPIFGAYATQNDNINEEIAVNLPDHSVDKIIKTIINDIFIATGDSRAQLQYHNKENYRKRGS